MRVEGHEINGLPKALERLNWLLKCKIINQEKVENKHKESGRRKMWHGVSRIKTSGAISWIFREESDSGL